MLAFLTEHIVEIVFGLISAGALALCKFMHSETKNYRKMLREKEAEAFDEKIEVKLEPIRQELEDLRAYIRRTNEIEKSHLELIIASYRFRLIQLCKGFLHQGYVTPMQYDQLIEFYKLYTGLGGNGQAKEYYEKAIKLEVKEID